MFFRKILLVFIFNEEMQRQARSQLIVTCQRNTQRCTSANGSTIAGVLADAIFIEKVGREFQP